jgi:hypothetical protein
MAKRFTDTDKWKKGFLKSLPSPYKIFWLYLCDECTNYGVWETSEIDVALIRTGEKFDLKTALDLFNAGEQRIYGFDANKKWFIPSFVTFQYGDDFLIKASKNRLIEQVRSFLEKFGLIEQIPVRGPLQRAANKDKDMDMDKDKEQGTGVVYLSTLKLGRGPNGAR